MREHPHGCTFLKGVLQVLAYPPLAVLKLCCSSGGSFFACRGVTELCPLVIMPTPVRNASCIHVFWRRDCESFIFLHVAEFLIIFFMRKVVQGAQGTLLGLVGKG